MIILRDKKQMKEFVICLVLITNISLPSCYANISAVSPLNNTQNQFKTI